jgi:hypothetical protein
VEATLRPQVFSETQEYFALVCALLSLLGSAMLFTGRGCLYAGRLQIQLIGLVDNGKEAARVRQEISDESEKGGQVSEESRFKGFDCERIACGDALLGAPRLGFGAIGQLSGGVERQYR